MSKVIFSGIQPSGNLHIGNYIGAIKQWVEIQNDSESIFCIVDLHAITIYQDPKVLKEKILEVAALYLACGIDSKKAKIFIQSENPDHAYLAWILDCVTSFGLLSRMTQFKDKSVKQSENTTVGLFNYPALMAADILLYDTDEVPVGEDQKQHIEFTRDVAERFNKAFCHPELVSGSQKLEMLKPFDLTQGPESFEGQVQHDGNKCIFKLPNPLIQKETARIMSLQNPMSKMSKSDNDPLGTINLLDTPAQIEEKIKRAVTDSGSEIIKREDKPAISNLLTIYSVFSGTSIKDIESQYKGKNYSVFKDDLANTLIIFLSSIQNKYKELRQDESFLKLVLNEGRDYSLGKSSKKVNQVKEVMGLGR